MTDPIAVLRTGHDRLAALVGPLDEAGGTTPSYDGGGAIAAAAPPLGTRAEISPAVLEAGLAGAEPPDRDAYPAIWDRWNATPPAEQVRNSVDADAGFVSRVEGLADDQ